eukprot:9471684-Pyramimonas_sp.AAC.1
MAASPSDLLSAGGPQPGSDEQLHVALRDALRTADVLALLGDQEVNGMATSLSQGWRPSPPFLGGETRSTDLVHPRR